MMMMMWLQLLFLCGVITSGDPTIAFPFSYSFFIASVLV
jgi:hypothetical protein